MLSKRSMALILAILVIVGGVFIYVYDNTTSNQAVISTVTPETTENTTKPVYVVSETVTPVPTDDTNVVVERVIIVSQGVTLAPFVPTTEAPTSIPTEVPTAEPTDIPTAVPTAEPTSVPTPTPTVVPTPEPTRDTSAYYEQIEKEMSTIIMSGGIYPEYYADPTYDLYNYINVDDLDEKKLFNLLSKPFKGGISCWTNIRFSEEQLEPLSMLSSALKSSICYYCERVEISDHPENKEVMTQIFDQIEQRGEYAQANRIMLDYLYRYTVKNPDNPYERLVLACNHE